MPILAAPVDVWDIITLEPQRQIVLTLQDCNIRSIPYGMVMYMQKGKKIISTGCWRNTAEGYELTWLEDNLNRPAPILKEPVP